MPPSERERRAWIAAAVPSVLVAIVAFQRIRRRRPVASVKITGVSQMLVGFVLVVATAVGVNA